VLDPSKLLVSKVREAFMHKAKSLYRVNCGQDSVGKVEAYKAGWAHV
jgi:hypothetical protein